MASHNYTYTQLPYQQRIKEISPVVLIAVATTEADKAIASSDFLKIMGISQQNEPTGVILVIFDHFASSDFIVWLRFPYIEYLPWIG